MSTAERLEELRDLPRTTAADRKRYHKWAIAAREDLRCAEPRHAADERWCYREGRQHNSVRQHPHNESPIEWPEDQFTFAQWRAHWRSLPDYDGPPMRAPSGVEWWRHAGADGFKRLVLPLDPVYSLTVWTEHLVATEMERWAPSAREKREMRVYEEAALRYARPSESGRGWCPKLAGVGK